MKKELVRFQALLDRRVYDRLRRLAFDQHRSMNAILREAVEAYLKKPKKKGA